MNAQQLLKALLRVSDVVRWLEHSVPAKFASKPVHILIMHQSQSFNYGPPPPQGQSPGQYATTQGPSSYPGYQHQQPQYPQGQQHPYQQPAQQPYVPQANSYQPQSQPFPPPGQPYSPQRSQYGLPTSSGPMPMPAQPYQQPQYGMPTFTPTPMSIPPQQVGPGHKRASLACCVPCHSITSPLL